MVKTTCHVNGNATSSRQHHLCVSLFCVTSLHVVQHCACFRPSSMFAVLTPPFSPCLQAVLPSFVHVCHTHLPLSLLVSHLCMLSSFIHIRCTHPPFLSSSPGSASVLCPHSPYSHLLFVHAFVLHPHSLYSHLPFVRAFVLYPCSPYSPAPFSLLVSRQCFRPWSTFAVLTPSLLVSCLTFNYLVLSHSLYNNIY